MRRITDRDPYAGDNPDFEAIQTPDDAVAAALASILGQQIAVADRLGVPVAPPSIEVTLPAPGVTPVGLHVTQS